MRADDVRHHFLIHPTRTEGEGFGSPPLSCPGGYAEGMSPLEQAEFWDHVAAFAYANDDDVVILTEPPEHGDTEAGPLGHGVNRPEEMDGHGDTT